MELVMRVLVEVEDEDVQKWAEFNRVDVDQQIAWLKEEVEKIIERAKELGLIEMPPLDWFIRKIEAVSPDHVGERHALPIARYLYDQLLLDKVF